MRCKACLPLAPALIILGSTPTANSGSREGGMQIFRIVVEEK